jgi:hypothetical protein
MPKSFHYWRESPQKEVFDVGLNSVTTNKGSVTCANRVSTRSGEGRFCPHLWSLVAVQSESFGRVEPRGNRRTMKAWHAI